MSDVFLANFLSEINVEKANLLLLEGVIKKHGMKRCALYKNSTISGKPVLLSACDSQTKNLLLRSDEAEHKTVIQFIPKDGAALIDLIGFSQHPLDLSEDERKLLESCLVEVYRRDYNITFMEKIRESIDFTNPDTYFSDAAQALSHALQMEKVAIREWDSGTESLRVIEFWSNQKNTSQSSVDFGGYSGSMPPPFQEVIDETLKYLQDKKHARGDFISIEPKFEDDIDLDRPRYAFLKSHANTQSVKAFAVFPIVMGRQIYGVISCATDVRFKFSDLEKNAIKTAMQLFAVSISNHLRYQEAKRLTEDAYEQVMTMTAIELAQFSKHQVANAQLTIDLTLDRLVDKTKKMIDTEWSEIIEDFESAKAQISTAARQLQFNTEALPSLSQKPVSLQQIWSDACDLMRSKLDAEKIEIKTADIKIIEDYFYSELLREAFINLLMNSLRAFQTRPRHNRWIRMDFRPVNAKKSVYELDYSDSAGGLIEPRIAVPDYINRQDRRIEELIFLPKVSSKMNKGVSTGWGLPLVRKVIGELHRGGISCISNREGCIFKIQLMKNLNENKIV